MPPLLCQGRVVNVWLNDPRGHNPKEHPVILVDLDEDIASRSEIVGVVASHTAAIRQPQLDTWIPLPFHPRGQCQSGFHKPTVAVCEWLVAIPKGAITEDMVRGRIQARYLEQIRNKLKEIKRKAEPS